MSLFQTNKITLNLFSRKNMVTVFQENANGTLIYPKINYRSSHILKKEIQTQTCNNNKL